MAGAIFEAIRAQLEALASPEMRARVMPVGDWPLVRIAPPASAADMRAFEAQVGDVPDGLARFFRDFSAGVEVAWQLRGRFDPPGSYHLVPDEMPPEPFMEYPRAPDAQGNYPPDLEQVPVITSGSLNLTLEGAARAFAAVPGWIDLYTPPPGGNPRQAGHFRGIREFMVGGHAFATAPNGDWLAVDQRAGTGCLLHVSHEGEESGIEIDLGLAEFVLHQAMLGVPGIDYPQVFMFSRTVEYSAGVDAPYSEATFDALSDAGEIWREWFWAPLGGPLAVDPALLGRCGGAAAVS
ncbi:hypothetical protein IV417_06800 [Alphaproteobacteria bacterium KMM 3653]|uniref:Uncharacterized protein n=1 Tax=Harenicola maris TaxID=2841044 RepID=A0AAP2G7Q7_9RHOB|nr:hypothetical protein [Harenicola maris]